MFPVGGRTTIGGPFGSFRQIGAHQGNDLFADFGTPVVAVADGTIENVGSLPISGNRLWVYADGGDEFFYAHMASFAPAAVNGRHVERGRSSATSATPATPSRPRRTCTSRSTRTAATPSIPTSSWSPGRSARAPPSPILPTPRRPRRGPRLHRRRSERARTRQKPTLVERMRSQREIHANRPLWQRALFVVAGFTLLLAGIAMLVLPARRWR